MQNSEYEDDLLARAARSDEAATSQLLDRYRDRLKRMVRLRLNPQITPRIDESDVVQEALLNASKKIREFASSPDVPFYLWLRQITLYKVRELHRRHLNTDQRDARREVRLQAGRDQYATPASAVVMVEELTGNLTSPSQAAVKSELRKQLFESLEQMDEVDREVLVLRHFEQFTIEQAAKILGLSKSGAGTRYLRALDRLRSVFPDVSIQT